MSDATGVTEVEVVSNNDPAQVEPQAVTKDVPATKEVGTETPVEGNQSVETATDNKDTDKEKPKPKTRLESRIDTLTARRYEAEAKAANLAKENAVLVEKLAALEKRPQPKAEDFEDEQAYLNATAKHHAQKEALSLAQETLNESVAQVTKDAERIQWEAHREREAEIVTVLPDYNEVTANSKAPITQFMGDAIMSSDVSANLFYELAKRPEEAEKIASLPPSAQFKEIGRLEAMIKMRRENPAPFVTESAQPTIRPAGTSGAVKAKFDPEKDPVDERWVEQRIKNKKW